MDNCALVCKHNHVRTRAQTHAHSRILPHNPLRLLHRYASCTALVGALSHVRLHTLSVHTVMPADVVSCTALVGALASGGEADKAEAVVQWMLRSGLQPNVRTYTALMSAMAVGGQCVRAVEVLYKMQLPEWGSVAPNTYSYSVLIKVGVGVCATTARCSVEERRSIRERSSTWVEEAGQADVCCYLLAGAYCDQQRVCCWKACNGFVCICLIRRCCPSGSALCPA